MAFNFDGFRLPPRARQTEITTPPVDTADRALLSRGSSPLVGAKRKQYQEITQAPAEARGLQVERGFGPGMAPPVLWNEEDAEAGLKWPTSAHVEPGILDPRFWAWNENNEVLNPIFNAPIVGSPFQFVLPPAIIPDEGEDDTPGDDEEYWVDNLVGVAQNILEAALHPGGPGSDPIQKQIAKKAQDIWNNTAEEIQYMLGLASEDWIRDLKDISAWEDNPRTSQQVEDMKESGWSNERIADYYRNSIYWNGTAWYAPDDPPYLGQSVIKEMLERLEESGFGPGRKWWENKGGGAPYQSVEGTPEGDYFKKAFLDAQQRVVDRESQNNEYTVRGELVDPQIGDAGDIDSETKRVLPAFATVTGEEGGPQGEWPRDRPSALSDWAEGFTNRNVSALPLLTASARAAAGDLEARGGDVESELTAEYHPSFLWREPYVTHEGEAEVTWGEPMEPHAKRYVTESGESVLEDDLRVRGVYGEGRRAVDIHELGHHLIDLGSFEVRNASEMLFSRLAAGDYSEDDQIRQIEENLMADSKNYAYMGVLPYEGEGAGRMIPGHMAMEVFTFVAQQGLQASPPEFLDILAPHINRAGESDVALYADVGQAPDLSEEWAAEQEQLKNAP